MFDHKNGCSYRKAASKFNITHTYVAKILKKENIFIPMAIFLG